MSREKGYAILNAMTTIIHEEVFGTIWLIGWLFTIGYLHLSFWKGVLGIFIWPYFIGVKMRKEHTPGV